jgi:hypothetical protein
MFWAAVSRAELQVNQFWLCILVHKLSHMISWPKLCVSLFLVCQLKSRPLDNLCYWLKRIESDEAAVKWRNIHVKFSGYLWTWSIFETGFKDKHARHDDVTKMSPLCRKPGIAIRRKSLTPGKVQVSRGWRELSDWTDSRLKSQSYFTTGGSQPISSSWCQPSCGSWTVSPALSLSFYNWSLAVTVFMQHLLCLEQPCPTWRPWYIIEQIFNINSNCKTRDIF